MVYQSLGLPNSIEIFNVLCNLESTQTGGL